MARSLTKRFIRMASEDQADALLGALPAGCDPLDFHIEGDPLPLRCAMYGSIQCLVALARSRPELAEAMLGLADASGERAIDWAGAYARADQARLLAELAPAAASSASASGHRPLSRALAQGRWEAAAFWLGLAPESAKAPGYAGRTALHLCAEPHFDFLRDQPAQAWSPPPPELCHALAAGVDDPGARTAKHHTALARAARAGNLPMAQAILAALSRRGPADLKEALSRGSAGFSPVHEAAWAGSASILPLLGAHGADFSELTERGFGALHLAIRHGSFEAAQALLSMGAAPDPAGCSTSCAVSALSSPEPERWLAFLGARGVDLDRRDDHGAHFAEVAWEKLGMERAAAIWDGLGSSKPGRDGFCFFGPLERAARSPLEPAAKLARLLAEGLRPARLDCSGSEPGADPRAVLDRIPDRRVRSRSFGTPKKMMLGAMWGTEPDLGLAHVQREGSGDASLDPEDDDSGFGYGPPKAKAAPTPDKFHRRPSLLAHCAVRNAMESLLALIEWDAARGWFRDADYLCAWREALGADANLAPLLALRCALAARGVELWGPCEVHACLGRLGPAKARELGAPIPTAGQAFLSHLKTMGADQAFLLSPESFSPNRKAFDCSGEAGTLANALESPWRSAVASEHEGAIRACLPPETAWPAITSLHAALCAAGTGKPALALWAAKDLARKAKLADPSSPWGREPSRAVELWDQQIRSELRAARELAPPPGARRRKERGAIGAEGHPEGSLSSVLLALMLRQGQAGEAARLVRMGLPAPTDFTRLADAIGERAVEATRVDGGGEPLRTLRDFVEALCERPDFSAILNRCSGAPILSRAPDPAIFDALAAAGADPGSGPDNACARLARQHASHLSPAFAERLALRSAALDPGSALAVASSMAATRAARGHGEFRLASSAAAMARALRAAAGADEAGWLSSYDQGFCPVSKALGAGNVDIALALAQGAPQSYKDRAAPCWMACWLASRIPVLAEALPTAAPAERRLAADAAMEGMAGELRALRALGAGFGGRPAVEAEAAAAALKDTRGRCAALAWLMERGFEPGERVDSLHLGYSGTHRFERMLGGSMARGRIPLAAVAMEEERDEAGARALGLLWSSNPALPQTMAESGKGSELPFHALLGPALSSLLEADLIAASLAPEPVGAKRAARL